MNLKRERDRKKQTNKQISEWRKLNVDYIESNMIKGLSSIIRNVCVYMCRFKFCKLISTTFSNNSFILFFCFLSNKSAFFARANFFSQVHVSDSHFRLISNFNNKKSVITTNSMSCVWKCCKQNMAAAKSNRLCSKIVEWYDSKCVSTCGADTHSHMCNRSHEPAHT